ncbi:MAG: hypothetical protein M0D55_20255 [Elusimicrobiota bacterium]|nr:MAG: hypothetical protein M0D55_20255 [Elusimicrobiota bacterium]
MSERPVQYFSDEALARSRKLTPEQALRVLEDFRLLRAEPRRERSRLISIRIPVDVLDAFKAKSARAGAPTRRRSSG